MDGRVEVGSSTAEDAAPRALAAEGRRSGASPAVGVLADAAPAAAGTKSRERARREAGAGEGGAREPAGASPETRAVRRLAPTEASVADGPAARLAPIDLLAGVGDAAGRPARGTRDAAVDEDDRETVAAPRAPARDARPSARRDTAPSGIRSAVSPRPEGEPGAPPPRRFGRYTLRRELGRGGVGCVYEAWDPKLERAVALKTLLTGRATEAQLERFAREVRAAAHLRHPNVVATHDAGHVDGRPYLTMDLIDGEPLDALIAREGALSPRRAVELILPVVHALEHAHAREVVHRDVKPENVLIDRVGHVYLVDFGLARVPGGSARLTRPEQAVGTPAFMAPEQLRGAEADPRMDVYSVGATLYECLTGRLPFTGDSFPELMRQILQDEAPPPRRIAERVPADLDAVVLRCLEKDPARRYPDATALARDLGRYLSGDAVEARAPSRGRQLARRLRAHLPLVAGAVVALCGLTGGAAFALVVRRETADEARRTEFLEAERGRLLASKRNAEAEVERERARRRALAEAALAETLEGQVAAYDRLLTRFPEAWEGHLERARLLRALVRARRARRADLEGAHGAARLALDDLRAARAAADDPEPILLLEAEVLRADLRDDEGALAAYEALAREDPAGPLGSYARARALAAAGAPAQALDAADATLDALPELTPARVLRAELLLALERPEEALGALDALAGVPGVEAEVLRLRAAALAAVGDADAALSEATRAAELDPLDADAQRLLGVLRLAQGQPGRALAALRRARALAPGDARVAAAITEAERALAGDGLRADGVAPVTSPAR